MTPPLTKEQRAALGRASWAKRPTAKAAPRLIRVKASVYEALDAMRCGRPWSAYLSDLAGLPTPVDGRKLPV